ncbi:hypothetical protein D9M72_474010 [compost metagenome]
MPHSVSVGCKDCEGFEGATSCVGHFVADTSNCDVDTDAGVSMSHSVRPVLLDLGYRSRELRHLRPFVRPLAASNEARVPSSTICPASITKMRSASQMVGRRCAITTRPVRPQHFVLHQHPGPGVHRARRLVQNHNGGRANNARAIPFAESG